MNLSLFILIGVKNVFGADDDIVKGWCVMVTKVLKGKLDIFSSI